jgi:hypothetical protein
MKHPKSAVRCIAVVALCVAVSAQTGPPADPNATRKADLVELVKLFVVA